MEKKGQEWEIKGSGGVVNVGQLQKEITELSFAQALLFLFLLVLSVPMLSLAILATF